MKRKKIRRVILITVLLLLLVVILIPLVWCIVLSFDRKALSTLPEFSLLPHEFSLFNYEVAFNTIPLVRYYINTIFCYRGTYLPCRIFCPDVRLCVCQGKICGKAVLVHFHAGGYDDSL